MADEETLPPDQDFVVMHHPDLEITPGEEPKTLRAAFDEVWKDRGWKLGPVPTKVPGARKEA